MPPSSSSLRQLQLQLQLQLLQRLAHRARPPPSRALSLPTSPCRHHGAPRRLPIPSRITHLPRAFSTSLRLRQGQQPQQVPPAGATSSHPTPPPPPPKPTRRHSRWFAAAVFLLIGVLSGTVVRVIIAPPPPPPPGSPEDLALRDDIQKLALKLPIVQKLLADPEWTHHEAYTALPPATRPQRITTGPLGSAAGIGAYQHIFHHAPTATVVDVVYLGPATVGWPGVVHGGLLATVLDEHTARAAMADPALRARGRGVLTARLDLRYRRPTLAGGFYVARARALREDELAEAERGKRDRKVWVDVTLETTAGVECAGGRALFVIPKGRDLRGVPEGF